MSQYSNIGPYENGKQDMGGCGPYLLDTVPAMASRVLPILGLGKVDLNFYECTLRSKGASVSYLADFIPISVR